MEATNRNLFIGVFLAALGLLAFELFSSRVLAIMVDPHMVFVVIAIAMLGMNSAAAMLSTVQGSFDLESRRRSIVWCSFLLGISVFATLYLFSTISEVHDKRLVDTFQEQGFDALVSKVLSSGFELTLFIGALLFVPYFLFGYLLTSVFRCCDSSIFHRLYFVDLVGAALGCILFVLALEYGGYQVGMISVLLPFFLAGLAFSGQKQGKLQVVLLGGVVASLVVSLSGSLSEYFEPKFDYRRSGRGAISRGSVNESWRTWNSYTRVALVDITEPKENFEWSSFNVGVGQGWALAPRYNPEPIDQLSKLTFAERRERFREIFSEPIRLIGNYGFNGPSAMASLFDPKRVLVIFAGAGREMIKIDQACGGECEINGVEINRQMVDHARGLKDFRLSEFYERPNISLTAAEGREYLERDKSKYDSILLSWCGGSISYYVGTSGHTAQFMYTKEAFESMLEHLNDGGLIITSEHNKPQQLAAIRGIFDERGWSHLNQSVVISRVKEMHSSSMTPFGRMWERQHLLLAPDGFTEEKLSEIRKLAEELELEIVHAPGYTHPDYSGYRQIIESPNLDQFLTEFTDKVGVDISPPSDDRPFSLDFAPRDLILQPTFWTNQKYNEDASVGFPFKFLAVRYLIIVCIVALILTLAPLILSGGPKLSRKNLEHLTFFLLIGLGFMLIEVGLAQKLGLLLGNPGYALAVVLGALIFSTGLGSLCSEKLFAGGSLSFRKAAGVLVAYALLGFFSLDTIIATSLSLGLTLKILLVIALLTPAGFVMGQMFPQGLKRAERDGEHLVAWAWAINGAASTIAASIGVLLSQPLGFNMVILCGACCYACILLLPSYGRGSGR